MLALSGTGLLPALSQPNRASRANDIRYASDSCCAQVELTLCDDDEDDYDTEKRQSLTTAGVARGASGWAPSCAQTREIRFEAGGRSRQPGGAGALIEIVTIDP
ncbi:hypothetical protein K431DRAFT_330065 [Polychaeton citri CBS 116435]|uniref:Uncharacterized protein n=1 Tax=Polychaeton citri CBS 116435 TaxID=1314669 RepID=A0A9P4Q479_9PEZI|nr:hypothetical protein K431DRAFT_330065 [Polychaeton citri CBS 116435]